MNINLSIAAAPGIPNYLIVAVYETATQNVVADFQVLPSPLVSDVNISFTGLNATTHYVRIWNNTTPTVGGTLKNSFIYDPEYSSATVTLRDDLFLTVGAEGENPVAGETSFTRDDLEGWEYGVFRRGFGDMEPDVDVQISNDGKTITLIKTDGVVNDVFGEGEVFTLHFEPQISTSSPIAEFNAGRIFSGTELIDEDRALVAADAGKAFRIQALNNVIDITLPELSAFPENRHMAFISEGGNHEAANLLCAGSDTIEFQGTTSQELILGKSERVWIYASEGVWVVSVAQGGWEHVGEIFQAYKTSGLNAVFCDGSLLDRAQYPRLWAWVQTLDASMLVTDTDWNNVVLNNKGRFSSGTDSTNFRVPELYAPGFLRAVDASTRKAGSKQVEEVGSHTHPGKRTRTDIVGSKYENNSIRSGSDRGLYTGDDITIAANSGAENRPANTGIYLLIRC